MTFLGTLLLAATTVVIPPPHPIQYHYRTWWHTYKYKPFYLETRLRTKHQSMFDVQGFHEEGYSARVTITVTILK